MSVCLKLFSWAEYRAAKGGIKVHVSIDESTLLPEIVNISMTKTSDRRGADNFRYPKDTVVADDRSFDCRLFRIRIEDGNHFVTRIKSNILYKSVEDNDLPEDTDFHILKEEIILLDGKSAKETGMNEHRLRRVTVYVEESNDTIELITDNMERATSAIAELYKRRWRIETSFKLIKTELTDKNVFGYERECLQIADIYRPDLLSAHGVNPPCYLQGLPGFGHFIMLIRVCLTQYNRLGIC